MKALAFYLYVLLHTHFCGCGTDHRQTGAQKLKKAYVIEQIGRVPAELKECSGLVLSANGNLLTHNDGGSPAEIIEISITGELLNRHPIQGLKNIDWEDITRDSSGHLYIGDFGNNLNSRTNLTIHKIRESDFSLVGSINFSYPDQRALPPNKHNRNFDCEAFFWQSNTLHLFTKDRTRKRHTKYYTLPDAPGQYTATLKDSLRLNAHITGAGVWAGGQTFALLGYGKVFLFQPDSDALLLNAKHGCIPFARAGQSEALCFINSTDFVFTNEQRQLFVARLK